MCIYTPNAPRFFSEILMKSVWKSGKNKVCDVRKEKMRFYIKNIVKSLVVCINMCKFALELHKYAKWG